MNLVACVSVRKPFPPGFCALARNVKWDAPCAIARGKVLKDSVNKILFYLFKNEIDPARRLYDSGRFGKIKA